MNRAALTPRQQQLINDHRAQRERLGYDGALWARNTAARLQAANARGQVLKSRRVGICAATGTPFAKGESIVYHDGKSFIA
jgi:hypothetical protein